MVPADHLSVPQVNSGTPLSHSVQYWQMSVDKECKGKIEGSSFGQYFKLL